MQLHKLYVCVCVRILEKQGATRGEEDEVWLSKKEDNTDRPVFLNYGECVGDTQGHYQIAVY